jgi:hypothetical protein
MDMVSKKQSKFNQNHYSHFQEITISCVGTHVKGTYFWRQCVHTHQAPPTYNGLTLKYRISMKSVQLLRRYRGIHTYTSHSKNHFSVFKTCKSVKILRQQHYVYKNEKETVLCNCRCNRFPHYRSTPHGIHDDPLTISGFYLSTWSMFQTVNYFLT